jgi:hypothetical protein
LFAFIALGLSGSVVQLCLVDNCDAFAKSLADNLSCDSEETCRAEFQKQLAEIIPIDANAVYQTRFRCRFPPFFFHFFFSLTFAKKDFVSNYSFACGDEIEGGKVFSPWTMFCSDHNTIEAFYDACRVVDSLPNLHQRIDELVAAGYWGPDSVNETLALSECLRKMGSKQCKQEKTGQLSFFDHVAGDPSKSDIGLCDEDIACIDAVTKCGSELKIRTFEISCLEDRIRHSVVYFDDHFSGLGIIDTLAADNE